MDYRSIFAETSQRQAQGSVLPASSGLSYSSSLYGWGVSSPVAQSRDSTLTSRLSPAAARSFLLSSLETSLDRTIRIHRRDAPPPTLPYPNSSGCGRNQLPGLSIPAPTPVHAPARRRLKSLPSASTSREVSERKRFLVFTKVLLKCIRRGNDERLHNQAKEIIADCILRNRYKDPNYMPLHEAVERNLRPVVGEGQWKRAQACLELFLEKKRLMKCSFPASADPLNVFPELCRPQARA